jgi:hypothetical protein
MHYSIIIASLTLQLVSLIMFIALSIELIYRARRVRESNLNFNFFDLGKGTIFYVFPYAIAVVTIAI